MCTIKICILHVEHLNIFSKLSLEFAKFLLEHIKKIKIRKWNKNKTLPLMSIKAYLNATQVSMFGSINHLLCCFIYQVKRGISSIRGNVTEEIWVRQKNFIVINRILILFFFQQMTVGSKVLFQQNWTSLVVQRLQVRFFTLFLNTFCIIFEKAMKIYWNQ